MISRTDLEYTKRNVQREYDKAMCADVPNIEEANKRLAQLELLDALIFQCRLKEGEFEEELKKAA